MEPQNHKIIKSFVSKDDSKEVKEWVESIKQDCNPKNHHISFIKSSLKGSSYMIDLSKTEITNYVCSFQSGYNILEIDVPPIIGLLVSRISSLAKIPSNNTFLQVINTEEGSTIKPHYDASVPGFINYKCNLSIVSEKYTFFIEDSKIEVDEGDLYCFEASLYKHWSNSFFLKKRILLSFGFLVPYETLGWNKEFPRVRLSERIQKKFQN